MASAKFLSDPGRIGYGKLKGCESRKVCCRQKVHSRELRRGTGVAGVKGIGLRFKWLQEIVITVQ